MVKLKYSNNLKRSTLKLVNNMVEIPEQSKEVGIKKEKEPKLKILILEDEFAEEAQRGISAEGIEVRLAKTLQELQEVEGFEPDLIILDKNVPRTQGEEPEDLSQETRKITEDKWPNKPIVFYSSLYHHERVAGVEFGEPETLLDSGHLEESLRQQGIPEDVIEEIKSMGDKRDPDSWKKLLKYTPYSFTSSERLLGVWQKLPEEFKKETLKVLKVLNPDLANSLERYDKYTP